MKIEILKNRVVHVDSDAATCLVFVQVDTYWELFQRFDTILASPHSARITKTLIYMIYMIHANACVYYGMSEFEGLCSTSWTYCTERGGSA